MIRSLLCVLLILCCVLVDQASARPWRAPCQGGACARRPFSSMQAAPGARVSRSALWGLWRVEVYGGPVAPQAQVR